MHAIAERPSARAPLVEQFTLLTIVIYAVEALVLRSPPAARHPDTISLARAGWREPADAAAGA